MSLYMFLTVADSWNFNFVENYSLFEICDSTDDVFGFDSIDWARHDLVRLTSEHMQICIHFAKMCVCVS